MLAFPEAVFQGSLTNLSKDNIPGRSAALIATRESRLVTDMKQMVLYSLLFMSRHVLSLQCEAVLVGCSNSPDTTD